MSSAGPYQYIDPTGVIVPDTSALLTEIQNEYVTSIASDLNTAPETPQGVLMNAETLVRAEVVANNAGVANQINPNIAGGVFLDAICALTGLDPPAATSSVVNGVSLTGVPGTSIPAGSQARSNAGDLFQTTDLIVLDGSGNGTVDFEAVEVGPVACVVNSLVNIVSGVLGWETVTNSSAAILGNSPPTDAQLRALRNATLALQGSSLAVAIISAVSAVSGVLNMAFRENTANSTQTINGISLVANSVWACVNGGTNADVAAALLASKSAGAAWNGATTVATVDPASGQSYNVKFDRPTAVPIVCTITVVLPPTGANSDDVIQALLDYAAGLISGQPGFVTGGNVSPFDMASAVVSEVTGVYVRNLIVGIKGGASPTPAEIALALNQLATLASSDITVIPAT